jgi:hypothetical protein
MAALGLFVSFDLYAKAGTGKQTAFNADTFVGSSASHNSWFLPVHREPLLQKSKQEVDHSE